LSKKAGDLKRSLNIYGASGVVKRLKFNEILKIEFFKGEPNSGTQRTNLITGTVETKGEQFSGFHR